MQDIDLFLPDLLTFVPNCPDILAFRWIREAAKVICTKTKLWREADQFPITPDDWEGVCTVSDASIVEIEDARLDGQSLTPLTNQELDKRQPGWQFDTEEGSPRYITQVKPDTVTVVPRATGTLQARLILAPSRTAMQLPDFLLEHHSLLVAKGAASYLLIQPKTDFENPSLGSALGQDFQTELAPIVVKALKGQHGAPLRTKPRY